MEDTRSNKIKLVKDSPMMMAESILSRIPALISRQPLGIRAGFKSKWNIFQSTEYCLDDEKLYNNNLKNRLIASKKVIELSQYIETDSRYRAPKELNDIARGNLDNINHRHLELTYWDGNSAEWSVDLLKSEDFSQFHNLILARTMYQYLVKPLIFNLVVDPRMAPSLKSDIFKEMED